MAHNDDTIDESMPTRLIRVLKKIKRKLGDGRTIDIEQAYHVRKAAPGDRYAQREQGSSLDMPEIEPQAPPEEPADAMSPEAQAEPEMLQPEPPPPRRLSVVPHNIPWEHETKENDSDPVPADIRRRFDPDNKAARKVNPMSSAIPAVAVSAGEALFWGANEPDIVDRLRFGRVASVRSTGSDSGAMLVKVESTDGAKYKAYLKIEGLIDQYVYDTWSEVYDLQRERGDASRRAASAYEVAKAAGLDDLVPPTVLRHDDYGDLDAILSPELVERRRAYVESIARATGEDPDVTRRCIGGYSSVQMFIPESTTIESEGWLRGMFAGGSGAEGSPKDDLNRIFEVMPPEVMVALVRTAVLDYLLWTGDRPLAGLAFCRDPRHPVHLLDNEICLPDPKQMLFMYEKHGGSYTDPVPVEAEHYPALWSDAVLMVAIRGSEEEIGVYEKVGVEVARRMAGSRATELARSLLAHRVPGDSVAALVFRSRLLKNYARDIARDPFFAIRYMAVVSDDTDMDPFEYTNKVMSEALASEYDFLSSLHHGVANESD